MPGVTESREVFQVDLRGMVDLLSHHLYSGPSVYLRELIQNAVDAITARAELEPDAPRSITIVPADASPDGKLRVLDTGIGLDEDGIRTALATIGGSTKRDDLGMARETFLGRFGIGLLSSFLVTDQVEVTTRRIGSDQSLLWIGRDQGDWSINPATPLAAPGTEVALAPRGSSSDLLGTDSVVRLAREFAGYLDIDITVLTANGPVTASGGSFPWEMGGAFSRDAVLWCQNHLGFEPLDVLSVADPATQTRAAVFILPTSSVTPPSSTIFAKRMFVTNSDHDLLPPWATFAHAVVNTSGLDLTASREGLRRDDSLTRTQETLGEQIRTWLLRLANTDPERANIFFRVHHLSAKAMATTDDAMLDIVAQLLPFETTLGTMTLVDYAREHRMLTYVDRPNQFRQLATVATAQNIPVINAGYAYDPEIIERFAFRTEGADSRLMAPEELATHIDQLEPAQEARFAGLIELARVVLARTEATPTVRSFQPATLQSILLMGDDAARRADRRLVAETVGGAWGETLESLQTTATGPSFVLNANNETVERLTTVDDIELQRLAIEAMYAQAVLAGRHPQTAFDTSLVIRALPQLIEQVIAGRNRP